MKRKGEKTDRVLRLADPEDGLEDNVFNSVWSSEMVVSGNLGLGKKGNTVTILIEDEVTGEQLEINGVRNAFLIVEDTRKASNGWLSLVIGSVDKVGEVIGFLSQTTIKAIKKLAGKEN